MPGRKSWLVGDLGLGDAALSHPSAPPRREWLPRTATALAGLMALLLILPVVALFWRAIGLSAAGLSLTARPILLALGLSLGTTAVSLILVILLGTPLALILAYRDFPGKKLLAVFVELPIVMPPVVAGLALLAAFGRRGLIGAPLLTFGISLTFTWWAVVLAQVFVSAPFYIRAAQSRFAALPRDLSEAASMDGANEWQTFWQVLVPLSRPALLAGLILSWARALGEFGATILFAGNLAGRTQTMPLLVYGALERDLAAAYVTAIILLALAGLALFVARWLARLDDSLADPLATS